MTLEQPWVRYAERMMENVRRFLRESAPGTVWPIKLSFGPSIMIYAQPPKPANDIEFVAMPLADTSFGVGEKVIPTVTTFPTS